MPQKIIPKTLLQRLVTPPNEWETELWHHVTPHAPLQMLRDTLVLGVHVLICSDAALDHAKFSMFSWIIHSTQELWSSNGIVLGHLEDVFSGRLEAFGILTGLHFLLNYTATFPITYPTAAPIVSILCDGISVLDQLTRIRNTTVPSSQETIADDNDVYSKIIQTIQHLQPIQIKLVYVKGLQD